MTYFIVDIIIERVDVELQNGIIFAVEGIWSHQRRDSSQSQKD